jgi:hypothetical protein
VRLDTEGGFAIEGVNGWKATAVAFSLSDAFLCCFAFNLRPHQACSSQQIGRRVAEYLLSGLPNIVLALDGFLVKEMPAAKKSRTINAILNDVIQRVNDDTQRLRILEQSSESLTSRMNSLEQGMLVNRREFQKAFSDINDGISSLDDRLVKMENTMKEVINHVKNLVSESQIKELQNLIELYNPIKSSFVTKEEMEKFVSQKLSQEKAGKGK